MKRIIFTILLMFGAACSAQSTLTGTLSSGIICGPVTASPACSNVPFVVATESGMYNGQITILQVNGRWTVQFPTTGIPAGIITTTPITNIDKTKPSVTYRLSGVDYDAVLTLNYTTYYAPIGGMRWMVTGGTIVFTAKVPASYINPNHPVGACYMQLFGIDYVIGWHGPDWYWGEYTYDNCLGIYVDFTPWF